MQAAQHKPFPIGVLASGNGTNLQAIIDQLHGGVVEIVAVGSDQPTAQALKRAESADIPTATFVREDYTDRQARDEAMASWLQERGAKLVVLAGYMQLVSPGFLQRFPNAVINVHPSLLPAFPGVDAIEEAFKYGSKVYGVTVHFVDESVDTGPIILQRAIECPIVDSADQIVQQLHRVEHQLLPEAIGLFAEGSLVVDPTNPRHVLVREP